MSLLETKANLEKLHMESAMIVSYYEDDSEVARKLVQYVLDYYKPVRKNANVFRGQTMETRAAAVTYFVLKKNHYQVNAKEFCDLTLVDRKRFSKCIRQFAAWRNEPYMLFNISPSRDATHILNNLKIDDNSFRDKCISFVEYVYRLYSPTTNRFSNNTLAATVWFAGHVEVQQISKSMIEKVWSCNAQSIGTEVKTIRILLGSPIRETNTLDLWQFDLNEIIKGVRQ